MKMNRVLWTLALALTLAVPSIAAAQGFYVGLRGGPAFGENVTIRRGGADPVERQHSGEFAVAGAAGYGFVFPVRVEGEFTYIRKSFEHQGLPQDGRVEHFLYMANAYYDVIFPFLGGFKPYVGAGIGLAHNEELLKRPGMSLEDRYNAFAYQFKAGIAYALTKSFDLSAGYRYAHIGGDTRLSPGGRALSLEGPSVHLLEFGVADKF